MLTKSLRPSGLKVQLHQRRQYFALLPIGIFKRKLAETKGNRLSPLIECHTYSFDYCAKVLRTLTRDCARDDSQEISTF